MELKSARLMVFDSCYILMKWLRVKLLICPIPTCFLIKYDWGVRITHSLYIREVLSYNKYLGLPILVEISNKKSFLFIEDQIKKWLSNWINWLVSLMGRKILITLVAHTIPINAMSVFKLLANLRHTIQFTINRFWWGHNPKEKKSR